MRSFVALVCVVLCGLAECGRASFVTPCRETDTECLIKSAQTILPVLAVGVPEFGIASMDPMHVKQVQATQGSLSMDFKDTEVSGLKDCKVLNLRRSGSEGYLDLQCSVKLVGDYVLGGQLFLMPAEGDGKYEFDIRDIVVKVKFETDEKTVNGEKYWTVKSWDHSFEIPKGVHYEFDNMFNGNKELSDTILNFANENWSIVFEHAAPPIVKAIVAQIVGEASKLFDNIPVKDLVVQ